MESYIDGIIDRNVEEVEENPREVEGVIIPEGFYYVGGSKSEGIVISDDETDLGKGTSHKAAQTLVGNQFVWIPVENEAKFIRYDAYESGKREDFITNCSEPDKNGYESEQEDYEKMVDSVVKNKGFYVGRYETGTLSNSERTEDSDVSDAAAVKQGKYVYNFIGWNDNGEMNNELGGAVELSKKFDTINGYTSVSSTLIYGVQWDAIMNFIDPDYSTVEGCEETSFVRDSTGRGNYTGNVLVTGSDQNYMIKNIYDLAGNVREWTMEASEEKRVNRGGYRSTTGYNNPASDRYRDNPDAKYKDIGFRIALYIN